MSGLLHGPRVYFDWPPQANPLYGLILHLPSIGSPVARSSLPYILEC